MLTLKHGEEAGGAVVVLLLRFEAGLVLLAVGLRARAAGLDEY